DYPWDVPYTIRWICLGYFRGNRWRRTWNYFWLLWWTNRYDYYENDGCFVSLPRNFISLSDCECPWRKFTKRHHRCCDFFCSCLCSNRQRFDIGSQTVGVY